MGVTNVSVPLLPLLLLLYVWAYYRSTCSPFLWKYNSRRLQLPPPDPSCCQVFRHRFSVLSLFGTKDFLLDSNLAIVLASSVSSNPSLSSMPQQFLQCVLAHCLPLKRDSPNCCRIPVKPALIFFFFCKLHFHGGAVFIRKCDNEAFP